ncbi:hypothetical protein CEXT_474721 [Caerostris extrusa]|uniref:Uncharacterized protein n=1 Tax=Caerostris extrusa TaxID=172846 RepID=A0AAV4T805_CAEEX|nr:hypothetical protein CEXT_474721 [Caerostris extrusa]
MVATSAHHGTLAPWWASAINSVAQLMCQAYLPGDRGSSRNVIRLRNDQLLWFVGSGISCVWFFAHRTRLQSKKGGGMWSVSLDVGWNVIKNQWQPINGTAGSVFRMPEVLVWARKILE